MNCQIEFAYDDVGMPCGKTAGLRSAPTVARRSVRLLRAGSRIRPVDWLTSISPNLEQMDRLYCAVAARMSFTSSGSPCAPSALQNRATPTPDPGRYRKNVVVDGSSPFIPTIFALPCHRETPQPSPKTLLFPSDVFWAVHILSTVSSLSTLPDATAITRRRTSSAEASNPPAG